ncbi:MAG TPA: hypothetical protein VGK38_08125 [Prolixibacteraceae bacterium]
MEVLFERGDATFVFDKEFDIKYLSPVARYVQWKLENHRWDDYNEFFHAVRLIEDLKLDRDVWFDTHCLLRDNLVTGVLLIVGGDLKKLETKYEIKDKSLLLKYFHIVDKGNGNGSFWLKSVIIPHYKQRGYKHIYINSSHPDSFPFYKRFGSSVATYEQASDNNRYRRQGRCFLINIDVDASGSPPSEFRCTESKP